MGRGLRFLCTGDLHVGRAPSRVENYADLRRCSCAAMVGRLVDEALRQQVDAVIISGDLIDRENRFYEAYGPVERGLRKLTESGIDVFAVAGNHDFDVLPRLARDLSRERFHFLGEYGQWQRQTMVRDGQPVLEVIGWSFPREHVTDNPLHTWQAFSGDGVPVIGLLHADLDQPASRYAPVATRDLHAAAVTLWLLGHVHAPSYVAADGGRGAILYPGSPQAMDPGECGTHGPWLVEIDPAGRIDARQIPMSRVRYQEITVDLTGIDTEEAFSSHVVHQVRAALEQCKDHWGPMQFCCCRVRLVGRTRLHRRLRDLCGPLRDGLELRLGDFLARIDAIRIDTRPAIDLDSLATRHDMPGELAKVILQLQGGLGEHADALTARFVERADGVCAGARFQPLRGDQHPAPDTCAARSALLRQGMLLLDALVAQKEPA